MPPGKEDVSRRDFLIATAFAGAAYAIASPSGSFPLGILGANDRLRVGVIGVGDTGLQHVSEFALQCNVEITALCDTSEYQMGKVSFQLGKAGFRKPELLTDFRLLLDRKDIDAVSIAVPPALRARMAIKACEAGKDVIIERPCCSGLKEGRELEMIAKQTQRVVQQSGDTPIFSAPELLTMLTTHGSNEILQISGTHCLQENAELLRYGRSQTARPPLFAQSLDVLDLARSVMGVRLPLQVSTASFVTANLPNVSMARFGFPHQDGSSRTIDLQTRVSGPASNNASFADAAKGSQYRDQVDTNGLGLRRTSHSLGDINLTFVTRQMKFSVDSTQERSVDHISTNNWSNFISCVRERNLKGLHNPIQEARLTSALVKLAEVSLMLGRGFAFDPLGERAADAEVDAFIQ